MEVKLKKGKPTFGERLHEARLSRKMTQEDVGKIAGCSRLNIGNIENGLYHPTFEIAIRLSDALGFSLDNLSPDICRIDGGRRKLEMIRRLETKLASLKKEEP